MPVADIVVIAAGMMWVMNEAARALRATTVACIRRA
jgi:hypothetical protein